MLGRPSKEPSQFVPGRPSKLLQAAAAGETRPPDAALVITSESSSLRSMSGTPRGTFNGGGGRSHADLAWQIIAGTDYYWTPKFSTFIEYHFLNYTSTQIDTDQDRDLRQHLVGAGVRVHF